MEKERDDETSYDLEFKMSIEDYQSGVEKGEPDAESHR